jgi:hypothetical protein
LRSEICEMTTGKVLVTGTMGFLASDICGLCS